MLADDDAAHYKIARLRSLLPSIEAAKRVGVSLQAIVNTLN